MRKGYGPLLLKAYGLNGFNPYEVLAMSCKIINEDVGDDEFRISVDLAHECFNQWALKWQSGRSSFGSISRPASAAEQEVVKSVNYYLVQKALTCNLDDKNSYFEFDDFFKSQIAEITDVSTFADGGVNERGANVISMTTMRLTMLHLSKGENQKMTITLAAALHLMVRYGEWLAER